MRWIHVISTLAIACLTLAVFNGCSVKRSGDTQPGPARPAAEQSGSGEAQTEKQGVKEAEESGVAEVREREEPGTAEVSPKARETAGILPDEEHADTVRSGSPVIVLSTPPWISRYTQIVVVRGTIEDSATERVHSLWWEILDSGHHAQILCDDSGRFEFAVPTLGLPPVFYLRIAGLTENGQSLERVIACIGGRERAVFRSTPQLSVPVDSTRIAARADQKAELPGIATRDKRRGQESAARVLSLFQPKNGAYFSRKLAVSGRLHDAQDRAISAAEVESLTWYVAGSTLGGELPLDEDGTFEAMIDTSMVHTESELFVRALGKDGWMDERAVRLQPVDRVIDSQADDGATEEGVGRKPPRSPKLTIVSPTERSYYRSEIRVQGILPHAAFIAWEIPSGGLGETVKTGEEGEFSFSIPAANLHGTQVLRISASGVAGSVEQCSIVLLDGNIAPCLEIVSPAPDTRYGAKIRISGRVLDPYAGSTEMGGIESVRYDITSPELFALVKSVPEGVLKLWEDGRFDATVDTHGLEGPQDVNIVARASNGNQVKTSIRINPGEADIARFTAQPGDRRAVLSWDPLPSAERYTLVYNTQNPGQSRGRGYSIDDARSPLAVTGLENGTRYTFQLRAVIKGEADALSAEKTLIPLSEQTLKPATSAEYRQITVSWPSIPGTEQYELWRADSPDGEFRQLSGPLEQNSYVDRDVQYGRSYWYRVTPAAVRDITSVPVAGTSTALPANKTEIASVYPLTQARAVALYGGYAFVAEGSAGMSIIDIAVPEQPVEVGAFASVQAEAVAVQGGMAFLADGPRGVKVLDITDPRNPVQIGFRKTMNARAIWVEGSTAFVADGESGLKVIDVSSPVQPVRIGSYATENACDLTLSGPYLYVADGEGGLRIFEIMQSNQLSQIAELGGFHARRIAVQGSMIYIAAADQGLIIVDVTDPGAPQRLGGWTTTDAEALAVSDSFAYVVDGIEGLCIFDVSDPSAPRRFADLPMEGAGFVALQGGYAYVISAKGLQIVHLLIQGRSAPIASYSTTAGVFAVRTDDSRAYVSCHENGIRVIDITDPPSLSVDSELGHWSGGYALDIEISESVAFVSGGRRGLSVIDISPAWDEDPATQPRQLSDYYTGGTAFRCVAESNTLYVADGRGGLKILDVSLPSALSEIGVLALAEARDVALSGRYLLAADAENGLLICDVEDPAAPRLLRTLDTGGIYRVLVQGDMAVTAGRSGLSFVDVSDPLNAEIIGRYGSAYVESMALQGRYLYLAEGHRGLKILDLSKPKNPVVVSSCPEIYAVDVALRDSYVLIADSEGLRVVKVLIPEWLR